MIAELELELLVMGRLLPSESKSDKRGGNNTQTAGIREPLAGWNATTGSANRIIGFPGLIFGTDH